MASLTGGIRSRNGSLQFSFRNVFMLSSEQKTFQSLEIVSVNIPTFTIILPSKVVLLFECVTD